MSLSQSHSEARPIGDVMVIDRRAGECAEKPGEQPTNLKK